MATKWRKTTIDRLGRIITGKTPPSSISGCFGGDIPFVTPTDLDGRRMIDSTCRCLTEKGLDVLYGSRITSGAIMVSCIGSDMGKVAISVHEGVTNQQINSVLVESGDFSLFVYYNLSVRKDEIRAAAGGSAQPILKKSSFGKFEILLPPLPEQRAIAHILGTLDDKIELNRKMNETLEAMARAIFKTWFIDFDPVRRNAARVRNQPSPPTPLPEGEGWSGHYRGGYDFAGLVETARKLRKTQTVAEELFWQLARNRKLMGLKFRRQHQLGDYIIDFYCCEYRIIIEFDGGVHASRRAKDHKRDAWMQAQGYKVLRFANEHLLDDPESVLAAIANALEQSAFSTPPSPHGRRVGNEGVVGSYAFDHLFPDRLVESELGEIPEGWEVFPLPEVIEVNPTRSLRKGVVAPYLDMANMPTQGHTPGIVIDRPFGSGMRFVNGDTLVARITPCLENGKTAYVDFLEEGQVGWGSTEYIVLRPKSPFPNEFAYCLARSDTFREFLIQSMTGSSGRQRVQPTSLSHYLLAVPTRKIAERFGSLVQPLFERASAAMEESRTLAALRDTLLPKLISGKILISENNKRSCRG